jgi:hypothetical protein
VAFESSASNLVAGDTNGVADVFVRDPAAGTTRVYSSGPGGAPGDAASHAPAFGAFGGFAYVAFGSSATNLGEDPHPGEGVFWRLNPTVGVAALDRPAENGDPQIEVLDVDDDGSHVLFASDSRSVVTRDALGRSV